MSGARHWWLQRITALLLVPLTLWFVFAVLQQVGETQRVVAAWVARPLVAAGLVAYLLVMFWHAQLGLQVIIEDYVAAPVARRRSIRVLGVLNGLGAVLAVGAVVRLVWVGG